MIVINLEIIHGQNIEKKLNCTQGSSYNTMHLDKHGKTFRKWPFIYKTAIYNLMIFSLQKR